MKTERTLSRLASLQPQKIDRTVSNREVIEQYLVAEEGTVDLTEKQKELLDRWTFADEKIRENNGKLKREGIANLIINRFGVNRSTAYQDMVNAEHIFSTSAPLNKRYRVALRIEFLENQIRLAATDNDHFSVAQLEKVLQKYYEQYPDLTPRETPKAPHFHINGNAVVDSIISTGEADAILDKQLEKLELIDDGIEDIDFEEVEKEEGDDS